jgi:hypothetical protein
VSLFTSETAKLATQKKEEMKQERREKTDAAFESPHVLLLLSLWQPFLVLLPTHLSQILKTADFLPLPVSLSWSLY